VRFSLTSLERNNNDCGKHVCSVYQCYFVLKLNIIIIVIK